MKRLINWLTGGRPMVACGVAFVDCVDHREVYYMVDGYGRWRLANGRWSWFRVARTVDDGEKP